MRLPAIGAGPSPDERTRSHVIVAWRGRRALVPPSKHDRRDVQCTTVEPRLADVVGLGRRWQVGRRKRRPIPAPAVSAPAASVPFLRMRVRATLQAGRATCATVFSSRWGSGGQRPRTEYSVPVETETRSGSNFQAYYGALVDPQQPGRTRPNVASHSGLEMYLSTCIRRVVRSSSVFCYL